MKNNLFINLVIGIAVLFLSIIAGFIIAKTGILLLGIILILITGAFLCTYILPNPFVGFLLIIFFLPFERVPTYNLAGVDIKINVLLGFLTLFAWLMALMFNAKKYKVQPNTIGIPLGLFIVALLLSITQAINETRLVTVLIFILFTVALSVLTVNMVSTIDNLKKTILVLLISSTTVGIFGLFQFAGDIIGLPQSITLLKTGYTSAVFGFPRIQSFSMEPLFFANYLLIPLSVVMAYFFAKVDFVKRWALIGMLILLLLNFVLTLSRGGYLGLIVTSLLFILFYFKQVFTWRNLAILVVIFIVFIGASFAISKGKPNAVSRFVNQATGQDAKIGSESIQGRLLSYDAAIKIYNDHSVLGIGLANYGPAISGYPKTPPIGGWPVVNNEYFEILAETGLIGGVTFAIFILFIIGRSLKALRKTKDEFLKSTMFGLFAAFVGILVQYNFFSTLYIIHIWVLIGLLIGVQNLILTNKE
jgi:O-antigen ligase